MSPETPAVSVQTPSAIPAGAYPTCTPAAADLLSRVVAARDLDHQRFTPRSRGSLATGPRRQGEHLSVGA